MQTEGIDGELYDTAQYIDVVYPDIKEKARKVHVALNNSAFLNAMFESESFDYAELILFKTNQSSLQMGVATEDFEVW